MTTSYDTREIKAAIDSEFAGKVAGYRLLLIECDLINGPATAAQKAEIDKLCADITAEYDITDINRRPAIAATRAAYKACGKDPNRYRPSQEQLMRRVVRGLGLYNVSALVDAGNQFSLLTGNSIGCFDLDKIEGDTLTVGIGREGEPYTGIGRGPLNVAGLPIVRDAAGGIGTPTSDNERTKISETTRHLVATVHLFDPQSDADEAAATIAGLLTRWCSATGIRTRLYPAAE